MPRASPKAASTTKHRSAVPTSKTHGSHPVKAVTIEQPVPIVQLPVPTSPIQRTKKRVVRRPKYHETTAFLDKESFKGLHPTDGLPPPGSHSTWFPGTSLAEAYRVASTMFQAAQQASLVTRPVSWGYGYTDGALGHNNSRRIVEIKWLASFRRGIVRAASAGNRLSLFLTDDNHVFQCGKLFLKQDGCAMWKPVEISMQEVEFSVSRPTIVAIEAGHLAAYALDEEGRVYSWGTQVFGQLGHGDEEQEEIPISEGFDAGEDNTETFVEDQDQCASHGEAGDDSEEEEDTEPPPKIVVVERTPRLVEGLAGHAIVKISAGNHFVVATSTRGAVFAWGRGCFGQLGNGDETDVSSPALVEALRDYIAIDIAAGMSHVLGVFITRNEPPSSNQQDVPSTEEHQEVLVTQHAIVMVWGRGKHGCLGLGGANNELLPRENAFFRGLGATKVAAGADHSLVLCSVGARTFLYAFGGNQLGQLGIASGADHVDMPSFLDEFVNVHIVDIGAGAQYSAALTGDGEVFTWGDARYGQTCRSDGRTTFVPWQIDLPSNIPSTSFITQLSIGHHHALAQLRIHGQVDRWRKFPLSSIVKALCHEEDDTKVSVCVCDSSQSSTRSTLGIFVQCETCQMSPLCRVCSRRCHSGHVLRPVAIGRKLRSVCLCSKGAMGTEVSCVFSKKLPPAIPEESTQLFS